MLSLYQICQFIQDSQIGTAIRESQIVFPVIESFHVLGLAVSAGTIVLLDLRLTGLGMQRVLPAQLMHRLKALYFAGFALMMVTGGLLFWAEAEKLYRSPTFRWKLVFLVIAALNATYYEVKYVPKMDQWDGKTVLPSGAKLAGWCSLISWAAVIGFGRWTAYGLN
jgi:hypothetical protein